MWIAAATAAAGVVGHTAGYAFEHGQMPYSVNLANTHTQGESKFQIKRNSCDNVTILSILFITTI